MKSYSTIFLDIGGVILSNGWDHALREKAAQTFQLDRVEMNKRHALMFDTYEIGKISLDDYLEKVVFYQPRTFSLQEFKEFMFSQSFSFPEMIELIRTLKKEQSLRIVAVSNEGRELMENRIKKFQLKSFIDIFICSSYVGLRKPDYAIYHLALDLSQAKPEEVIYIDDRPLLAEIGRSLGLQTIQHSSVDQTRKLLYDLLQRAI